MTDLCRGKPPEFWETGHGGNRLALFICARCPTTRDRCLAGDPKPHGVVRAGVAWSDAGKPLPLCHCGYPVVNFRGGQPGECPWCDPKPAPDRRLLDRVGPYDEAAVQRLLAGDIPVFVSRADRREALRRLWTAGVDNRTVAARLRMTVKAVRRARQRWQAGVWAWAS